LAETNLYSITEFLLDIGGPVDYVRQSDAYPRVVDAYGKLENKVYELSLSGEQWYNKGAFSHCYLRGIKSLFMDFFNEKYSDGFDSDTDFDRQHSKMHILHAVQGMIMQCDTYIEQYNNQCKN
jgi:hypothetical protein